MNEHKITKHIPTNQTYSELQQAYEHFNNYLFDGILPYCLITLQRERRSYGYFSAKRFAHIDGSLTDEIAMNPTYFAAVPLVETMQTLVHEMCHLWQHHFGNPGRGRYHNRQWAIKMESIGLMPSSTGKPNGQKTGDCMADYAIEDGLFLKACEALFTQSFKISWYDRFVNIEQVINGQNSFAIRLSEQLGGKKLPAENIDCFSNLMTELAEFNNELPFNNIPLVNKSNRVKYMCSCNKAVWGKIGLFIICGECRETFISQNYKNLS